MAYIPPFTFDDALYLPAWACIKTRSVNAVNGRAKVGAHVGAQHFQRRLGEFCIDVGDRIGRDYNIEVADVAVQRGVEDALFGDLSGEDEGLGLPASQQVGPRGCV